MLKINMADGLACITGDTFPVRDRLRRGGARWDEARRAWVLADLASAERLVAEITSASTAQKKPNERAIVAGRAVYKDRVYYAAGREDNPLSPVTSRDGERMLLYFRDGSAQFWANASDVTFRPYSGPQTLGSLRAAADRVRRAAAGDPGLEPGYRIRNGQVIAAGCAECARLGRMCRTCRHDFE